MNILVANWTWYPSGGDWTYIENIVELYKRNGHTVIPFSMHDDRNIPSTMEKYFINRIDYKELNRNKTLPNVLKVLKSSIYSLEAKKKLELLLQEEYVDIVHLNNIHNYHTLSIIPLLKKRHIPIIWTLHDYKMLCPNTTFLSKGEICESCKRAKYYYCTFKKCKKNSYLASFVASLESYYNSFAHYYYDVDYFICPSRFLYNKLIEYGFPNKKIVWLPNCFDAHSLSRDHASSISLKNEYIVYIGRLESHKGILTLIKAFQLLSDPIKLVVIGDGTMRIELEEYIRENNVRNVELLGKMNKNEVMQYIENSLFTVCPSEWYENFPYSIIESMVLSKPVVGARIGGIPEMIDDGETGLLFEPGNCNDLKCKLNVLLNNNQLRKDMGNKAKEKASIDYNTDSHYNSLMKIFNELQISVYK